jgi:prevent-host-death family protein
MITIPFITTVADLQRRYRLLVDNIKVTGKPMIVVNNGKPDVVVMDVKTYEDQVLRLKELEEEYLLRIARDGFEEYKKGKSTKLGKNQKLLNFIE